MLPALLIMLLGTAAFGQTTDTAEPVFDVASVKASQSGRGGGPGRFDPVQVSPGTVTMRNANLRSAIRWAYHVTDFQVSGPEWLDSQRYEIVGKASVPASEEHLRLMMQALLKERFKLAFHRQIKDLQTYVLSVGKNGTRLQESKTEGETSLEPNQKQMSVTVQRAPVSQLTGMLEQVLRAPVLDMTGLKGRYDVTLNVAKYAADMAARGQEAAMDPLAMIRPILQEEFGLKLEARKMPLDLLVIDHLEKAPVEN